MLQGEIRVYEIRVYEYVYEYVVCRLPPYSYTYSYTRISPKPLRGPPAWSMACS